MNKNSVENLCEMLANTYKLGVYCYDEGGLPAFSGEGRRYPLFDLRAFETICYVKKDKLYKEVNIYQNRYGMSCIGIPLIINNPLRGVILIGPYLIHNVSDENIMKFVQELEITEERKKELVEYLLRAPIYPYDSYIKIIKTTYYYINNNVFDENCLNPLNDRKQTEDLFKGLKSSQISLSKLEFHGTYMQERAVIEVIRTGNLEELTKLVVVGKYGDISNGNELRQQKNLFIVTTTLATRAAIDGGVNSEIALTISDMYIRQMEALKSIPKILELSLKMIYDFTRRVHELIELKIYHTITNKTMNYIKTHVYEDVKLSDIASNLKISEGHLSRSFYKETGKSVVDYVKEVKINEAKYFLKYTNYTLLEISEKLSFSSQSYFGKVFKDNSGISPKQFRDEVKEIAKY